MTAAPNELPSALRALKLAADLASLEHMTVAELVEKFAELFGRPTRTRNGAYLRKRLRWRMQELTYGGLPEGALARIAALGDGVPERWRMRLDASALPLPAPADASAAPASPRRPRDARLPPSGSILRRSFGGAVHEVFVHEEDFEFAGQRYKTLSAVAFAITGKRWNGFLFFGLAQAKTEAR
jgi:hypothetical protein